MSKSAFSLSEAIEKLESVSSAKTEEIKDHLEKDYHEIKKTLESLKPFLKDLKVDVEKEASAAKHQVEEKVKENPWAALGVIGVVAFIIGWLLGNNRNK